MAIGGNWSETVVLVFIDNYYFGLRFSDNRLSVSIIRRRPSTGIHSYDVW